ncbi:ribose-5-phosphate isomerase [Neoactinobaculum massilliense]|uniref:ribose-5-phosphate isomerase n=1 Tax=Neoactinobaculum massilliense TaxID=2364794 RepID=UPI000F53B9A3|nr:ribose-5-phosphate isomerase [Neoactinobaculum massilliense]
MRVHIGTDHAGFELKEYVKAELAKAGYEVIDHGAETYNSDDDYPAFCIAAAEGVIADPGSLGIVIGGSGNGEQVSANKVKGIRAILAWNEDTAKLGREHNNANVVSVGARQHSKEEALQLIKWFLETPFSEGERHIRRIKKIAAYENGGSAE